MSIPQKQSVLQDIHAISPIKPHWHEGKLLSVRMVGRDPLTSVAYFDAVDLTASAALAQRESIRAEARLALGEEYAVSIHADMVKVKSLAALGSKSNAAIGGKRGAVRGFSAASRKRLIEFMASVRYDTQLLFATFTYPDEFPIDNPDEWNRHFEALRRRFERRFPRWRCIWRMELKERQSGANAGQIAPHYHLLIFTDNGNKPAIKTERIFNRGQWHQKTVSPLSVLVETWALEAWPEIVDSGDPEHGRHGAFVVACRNRKHAYKYVSKYVAKEDNDEYEVGRRWGRIGTFDTEPSRTGTMSRRQYVEFKRLVRRWMKANGRDYHKRLAQQTPSKGCTILGLGDGLLSGDQCEDLTRLLYRMLRHAGEIVEEPMYFLLTWERCE